jgi:hypothetical protein
MTAQERLRRQTSSLLKPGLDPYNTADSIRISRELAQDFLVWVTDPLPAEALTGDGYLRRRQAG